MAHPSFYIHPTAEVSPDAYIGAGSRIWAQVQVREHAHVGETCNIGKGVYIDRHVQIGSNVKIQNHASLFEGLTVSQTYDEYDISSCLDGQMGRRNRYPPSTSHPGGQAQLLRPYLLPRPRLGVGECVGKFLAQGIVGAVHVGLNASAIR
jgi:Bacterial transferase hexapeptide (six repeats)